VRNKKFKYFKDKTLKNLCGVIDFDRVQSVVLIEDDDNSSDEEKRTDELLRFKIDVIGSRRKFVFKVQNSSLLRKWA